MIAQITAVIAVGKGGVVSVLNAGSEYQVPCNPCNERAKHNAKSGVKTFRHAPKRQARNKQTHRKANATQQRNAINLTVGCACGQFCQACFDRQKHRPHYAHLFADEQTHRNAKRYGVQECGKWSTRQINPCIGEGK